MDSLKLTPTDSEVEIDVSIERLYKEIGEQGILSGDGDGFFYLAGLALECYEDERYTITDTLMEFIQNSGEFEHVTQEAADDIEKLLR